jgi:hypothetical protein
MREYLEIDLANIRERIYEIEYVIYGQPGTNDKLEDFDIAQIFHEKREELKRVMIVLMEVIDSLPAFG